MSKRPYVIAGWVGVAVLCLALVKMNAPTANPPAGKQNVHTTRAKVMDIGTPGSVPGAGYVPGANTGMGPAAGTGYGMPGYDPNTAGMDTGGVGTGAGTMPYTGNPGMAPAPAAGNGGNARTGTNAGGTTTGGAAQSTDTTVLSLVNAERSKAGLSPLTLNSQLSNVARTKAQDMRDQNYFDHTSPTYGSPSDMIKQFNVPFGAVGENIAAGQRTPAEVMQGWMNSEGHRRNILDPQFTQMGLGSVEGGQMGTYWSQMFISQ